MAGEWEKPAAPMDKVFLSSTSRDLETYREAVHRAIDGLPGFSLVKMEDFGARAASAKELCAGLVRECDLFVGLMGHYYGSCPPDEAVSFTELEYRTATAAGLPRLMFLAPDAFLIPASLRESDESFKRQQALRREVMTELVVAAFDSPEKLASAVTRALFVWHEERRQAAPPIGAGEVRKPGPPGEAPEAATPLGANPYRGLEAFHKEDAQRFFGREALVDQLWDAFLELHATRADGPAPTRLLAILGASGSGKSSLAQAGLLAALEQRPLPGRPVPIEVVFTPEARPLESLAVALARRATNEPSPARAASEFETVLRTRAGDDGLRYLAERMLDAGGAGLILLVDQFEELYSLCDDERERAAFIGNLLHAAREPRGRVSILLTLRSDFLGAVNHHPELSGLIARQNVVVPVMDEAGLRRAIEEPARRAGRAIDPGTVDLLVEQTSGREGALPLLEFVLTRIWDGFLAGAPAAETVRALGGVGGALANQAQAVYDSLGQAERPIARRAFLAMVRLGEGTKDSRRRAPLAEIVTSGDSEARVLALLRRFAEPGRRLITLAGAGQAATAEVAHEALFDHWRLLQQWLDASRGDIRFHRQLNDAATHWHDGGRPSGSLWRPPDLDLLRDFRKRAGDDLTALEVAFADTSERQEGRRRWLQHSGIAAAIGGLLLVAGGLTFYSHQQIEFARQQESLRDQADMAKEEAFIQAHTAEDEKQRADAQRDQVLRTQSLFLAEMAVQETRRGDATNGILLALEALPKDVSNPDRPYAAQAEAALYEAVLQQRELAVLEGHGERVLSAAFNGDGVRLVTAAEDGTVRLWDANGQPLAVLQGHGGAVRRAAFSPDGARVVTASEDRTARIWDAASGRQLAVLQGHEGAVRSAAFSPDGARVVTGSEDRTARIWDAASGRQLAALQGHDGAVRSAAFSADGARVVTGSDDRTARVWDAASGQQLAVLQGHERGVVSAAFSPDGTRVVTASDDRTARLWDAASGRELALLRGHEDQVRWAAFSPDGAEVVTASSDRSARLWDAASGQPLAVLQGHEGPVWWAAFSPDGAKVVTASADGTARLWRAGSSGMVTLLRGHVGTVKMARFDPSGRLIITASYDRTAALWDSAEGRRLQVLQGHADVVRSAAFDRHGARAVTASDDGTARIWEIPSGRELAVLKGGGEKLRAAEFSPGGEAIAVATSIGTAELFDLKSGDEIHVFKGSEGSLRSTDFSADGRRLLTASYDGTARVWDVTSGNELVRLEGKPALNDAAFSPDGRQVVTAATDGVARVWDLAKRQVVSTLSGHQGPVSSARFSPDGRRIISASDDGTARLWDAAGGQQLAVLRGHEGRVSWAAFSPDGTRVVTASDDRTARIWPVFATTQALIDYAKTIVPRQLTPAQRRQFFLEVD